MQILLISDDDFLQQPDHAHFRHASNFHYSDGLSDYGYDYDYGNGDDYDYVSPLYLLLIKLKREY